MSNHNSNSESNNSIAFASIDTGGPSNSSSSEREIPSRIQELFNKKWRILQLREFVLEELKTTDLELDLSSNNLWESLNTMKSLDLLQFLTTTEINKVIQEFQDCKIDTSLHHIFFRIIAGKILEISAESRRTVASSAPTAPIAPAPPTLLTPVPSISSPQPNVSLIQTENNLKIPTSLTSLGTQVPMNTGNSSTSSSVDNGIQFLPTHARKLFENVIWNSSALKKIIQDILLVALEDESDITESLCHELGQLRRISWDMFADLRKTNGVAFNNDTVLNVIKSIKADPEVDIIAFQHIASKIVQAIEKNKLEDVAQLNDYLKQKSSFTSRYLSMKSPPAQKRKVIPSVSLIERDIELEDIKGWVKKGAKILYVSEAVHQRETLLPMACVGAPGTGKTALTEQFLINCFPNVLAGYTHQGQAIHTIPIYCTLNSSSLFKEEIECARHPESSVAWRILGHYFDDATLAFEPISLSPFTALDYIAAYERKSRGIKGPIAFGLVMDEYQKVLGAPVSSKYDAEYATLTDSMKKDRRFMKHMLGGLALGLADQTKRGYTYFLMVSGSSMMESTSFYGENSQQKGSKMLCNAIIPRHLSSDGIFVFAKKEETNNNNNWLMDTRIRQQLALTGGQPRALVIYFNSNTYLLNTKMMKDQSFIDSAHPYIHELVALSFLREKVKLDQVVGCYNGNRDSPFSVNDAIQNGFCTVVEEYKDGSMVVTIPPFVLETYCSTILNNINVNGRNRSISGSYYASNSVVYRFVQCINLFLEKLSGTRIIDNFQYFEFYTASMLLVKKWAKLVLFLPKGDLQEFSATVPYSSLFNDVPNNCSFNIQLSDKMNLELTTLQSELESLQGFELASDTMKLCHQGQEAIGFISKHKTDNGEVLLELGQCKCKSPADSESLVSVDSILKDMQNFAKDKDTNTVCSFLVLSTSRVSEGVTTNNLEPNCVILTFDSLPKYFTNFWLLVEHHFGLHANLNHANYLFVHLWRWSIDYGLGCSQEKWKIIVPNLINRRPFDSKAAFLDVLTKELQNQGIDIDKNSKSNNTNINNNNNNKNNNNKEDARSGLLKRLLV